MTDLFRQNAFGEKIAQPPATFANIESVLFDRYTPDKIDLWSADLFINEDELFKFGGTLYFTLTTDEGGEDEDHNDATMEFDGHESLEAAKTWLAGLGLSPGSINEVN